MGGRFKNREQQLVVNSKKKKGSNQKMLANWGDIEVHKVLTLKAKKLDRPPYNRHNKLLVPPYVIVIV